MSRSSTHHDVDRSALAALLALAALAALFPPETRGESLAGCAALIAMSAALRWLGAGNGVGAMPLLAVPALALPLVRLSAAPGAAVEPLALWLLAPVAGLAAAGLSKDLRRGTALPVTLAAIAAAVAAYGVYQSLWGLPALVERIEHGLPVADRAAVLERAAAGRAFAGFPTPAALGGFLALSLPISVAAAVGRRGRARWLFVAAALVQLAALLATASATAAAALIGATALATLVRRGGWRTWLVVAGAGLLLVGGVVVLRGAEIVDPGHRNSPWRLRAANARLAAAVIADHPWTGVGPGGFGEVYPQYRRSGDNESRHVHDLPLEAAAELGLPAGAALSLAFFWLFVGPLFRRSAEMPAWWRGAAIGLTAFALHNLVDFTAFLPSMLWIAAVVRGWIARRERREPSAARATGAALTATVCLAAACAGLGGVAWNARSAARQALAAGDGQRAADLARRATALAPWHPDGWMLRARLDADRGAAGLEEADRAVAASPVRPAARRLRAGLRLREGDAPGALSDAIVAERLYPMDEDYARWRRSLEAELKRSLPAVSGRQ